MSTSSWSLPLLVTVVALTLAYFVTSQQTGGPASSSCSYGTGAGNLSRRAEIQHGPSWPGSGAGSAAVPLAPNTAPLQSGLADSFEQSDTSREYYETFAPQSLNSLMPGGWRNSAAPVDPEGTYSEFSRYTITPQAVQRAESLQGVMRLSELTSTRNSRSLGVPSLLRSFVTPTRPVPIGDKAFVFNDSSVRQGFIAAATGAYPVETNC